MKRFTLSPEAAQDIREIWSSIAQDNLRAARRVRLLLLEACQALANHPGIGHRREDLTDKAVLFWPVGLYLLVYNPASRPVAIVRVLHGARNIPAVLTAE